MNSRPVDSGHSSESCGSVNTFEVGGTLSYIRKIAESHYEAGYVMVAETDRGLGLFYFVHHEYPLRD